MDPAITNLMLKDGKSGQSEAVTTTPEHPFYVQAQADALPRPRPVGHEDLNTHWVGAGHLQIGDKIKLSNKSIISGKLIMEVAYYASEQSYLPNIPRKLRDFGYILKIRPRLAGCGPKIYPKGTY